MLTPTLHTICMTTFTNSFYTHTFSNIRTYFTAALLVAGNLLLPQLFHLFPQGGATWLPIYFFTLIGAWCYGWRVGLLTAIASPLLNNFLYGMPLIQVLPAILLKSTLLALLAAWTAHRCRQVSLLLLTCVVVGYQTIGCLCEWGLTGSWIIACQDFRIGIPGMLLQIFGGWMLINVFLKTKAKN